MCQIDSGIIEVRDLRDGSVVTKAPKSPSSGPGFAYPAEYRLEQYVLKENGSLAWTLALYSLAPPNIGLLPRREVWALDSHGQRLLDAGPDIELRSLALNGSTLTWSNGGSARSATLD